MRVTSSHILGPGKLASEGDVLDLPDDEARAKITQGYAVLHTKPAATSPLTDAPGPTTDSTSRQEEGSAGAEEETHPEAGNDQVVDREPSVQNRDPRRLAAARRS